MTDWMVELRQSSADSLPAIAQWLGVESGELVAGPFALRATALGIEQGALLTRHESRACVPWRSKLCGATQASDDDHGQWVAGALVTGRYQSFCLDGAFATMNPNHSSRWTAHELLHRAIGFAWRPDMPRWEHYRVNRLAELLPVVHWYGFDRFCRLDERGDYDPHTDAKSPDSPVEEALWWREPREHLQRRALLCDKMLSDAMAHYQSELSALASEAQTLEPTPAAHGLLNSSSDALAYVAGHMTRLEDEHIANMLCAVVRPLPAKDFSDMFKRIATVLDDLLFSDIELDPEIVHARALGRTLWDICHRTVHVLGTPPEAIDWTNVAAACDAAYLGDARLALEQIEIICVSMPRSSEILALGLLQDENLSTPWVDIDQLIEGVEAVAPATSVWLEHRGRLDEVIKSLACSVARGPLISRLRDTVQTLVPTEDRAKALVEFEYTLQGATRRDDLTEHLSSHLSGPVDNGWLRPNPVFRALRFDADIPEFAWHLQQGASIPQIGPGGTWLVGNVGGQVHVIHLQGPLESVWDALPCSIDEVSRLVETLAPDWGDHWLGELTHAGAVAVMPPPGTA